MILHMLLSVAAAGVFTAVCPAQYNTGAYTGANTASNGSTPSNYVYPSVTAKGATFARYLGDPDAGVVLRADARVERLTAPINSTTEARRFSASSNLRGRVYLGGLNIEAVGVAALGKVQNGDWTSSQGYIDQTSFQLRGHYEASFTLRLGGVPRITRSYTGVTDVVRQENRTFNLPTILHYEHTFWIYFVPVTVEVDVGAEATIGLTAALRPINLSASLVGSANGYAFGRASAGVGVGCVTLAGLEVDLRLLDTTLNLNLLASDLAGLQGTLGYTMNAVRILVRVFGEYCLGSWSHTLWDKSFGTVSGILNLF